jgi:hypothetical protein
MTGNEFGRALGFTGKHQRKSVWAVETGKRKPSGPTLLMKQLAKPVTSKSTENSEAAESYF